MYTSWFYYILVLITISFLFRLIGPFILPLLVVYLVYTFIRNRQRIKAMRDLHKASKTFEKEWENVTSSQEYQRGTSADVEDADYTIKED